MKSIILKYAPAFMAGAILATSCDDVFEPSKENIRDIEVVKENGNYMSGVLGYAYGILPIDTKSVTDVATDDATTNEVSSSYYTMCTSWNSTNTPVSNWTSCLATINNLNIFLANLGSTQWCADEVRNKLYDERMSGEAYALRALNMYYLLRNQGGKTADGQFLGFPIFTEPFADGFDYNLARNTMQECVDQIYADLDKAIEILPDDYADIEDDDLVPDRYKAMGATAAQYNKAFGVYLKGRVSGKIARAIKSQVALLVASPAFDGSTTVDYAEAAKLSADLLKMIGGVSGMDPNGNTWYCNTAELDALAAGTCPAEILWRGDIDKSTESYALGSNQEQNNFPPTLNGKGRINPSQNLVDAFGMANGYPITSSSSSYDKENPYSNRDPRLDLYIVHDGSTLSDTEIKTGIYDGATNDGLKKSDNATHTGYYMKKLLRDDVIIDNSGNVTAQTHYSARIRFTEIFLNYAEAANEAYGPKADGGNGFSAYDVIKAIRERAGITDESYLDECAADKEKMRELIRNERRIELCFENHRFWDLRRWNANLNETVKGVEISKSGDTKSYKYIDVAPRDFKDYMIYCPIPNSEILKWSNLAQNIGW